MTAPAAARKPAPGVGWNPHTEAPIIPQTVKSRVRECGAWTILPATVLPDGTVAAMNVRTGETFGPDELARELRALGLARKRVAVATDTPGELYEYLRDAGPAAGAGFKAHGFVREAPGYLRTGGVSRLHQVVAAFTTFRWQRNRSGIVLDPTAFCGEPPAEVIGSRPTDTPAERLFRLALWAASVVKWCQDSGFDLRPGRGGIAAQALTDARWWPERRRKVPHILNELARPELPGNLYAEFSRERHRSAMELDQRGAHHQAAARIAFTDSDTIAALGHYTDPKGARVFCRPTDPRWGDLTGRPGLFWLRVRVELDPHDDSPRLPQLAEPGERTVPVWSVELPELIATPGVSVLWCVAAVVSDPRGGASPGLNGFARWALGELDRAGASAEGRWLKPMLLAVYGTLAQQARPVGRFSSEPTPASAPEPVVIGGQPIMAHVSRSSRPAEPRYVNVIDRGLIEAETRAESLRMARALRASEDQAHAELVAIYADAVLVAAPDGSRGGVWAGDSEEHARWARAHDIRSEWRMRERHNLQMLARNSYKSDEVTKMPGVPKDKR